MSLVNHPHSRSWLRFEIQVREGEGQATEIEIQLQQGKRAEGEEKTSGPKSSVSSIQRNTIPGPVLQKSPAAASEIEGVWLKVDVTKGEGGGKTEGRGG